MIGFETPTEALKAASILVALNMGVAALEWFSLRRHFNDTGAFGRPALLLYTVRKRPVNSIRVALVRALSRWAPERAGQYALVTVDMLLCAIVVVGADSRLAAFALWMLLAMRLGSPLTRPLGPDGGDRMQLIVLAACCIGRLPIDESTRAWCCVFIAVNVLMAYVTAGLTKIVVPGWRDGSIMRGAASSQTFGRPWLSRYLEKNPTMAVAAGWGVIWLELLLPIAVLCGGATLAIGLATGVVFHILNAWIFGLGNFTLAFVATYPSVIYFAYRIQG